MAALTHFADLTDMAITPRADKLEIIHQYRAHDKENAIAQIQQISFNPERPKYQTYIRDHIKQGFFTFIKKTSI